MSSVAARNPKAGEEVAKRMAQANAAAKNKRPTPPKPEDPKAKNTEKTKEDSRSIGEQMVKDGTTAMKSAATEMAKNAASEALGPIIELTIGNFCHIYNMVTSFMPGVRSMVNNKLAEFLSDDVDQANPQKERVVISPKQIEQVLKHPGEAIEILGPDMAKKLSDKLSVIDKDKLAEAGKKGKLSYAQEFTSQILGLFGGDEAQKAGLVKGAFIAAKSTVTKPVMWVWNAFKNAKGIKKIGVAVGGGFGLLIGFKLCIGLAKGVFKILWKPIEWALGIGASIFGIKKVGSMFGGKGKGAPKGAAKGGGGENTLHQKALTKAHGALNAMGMGNPIVNGAIQKAKDMLPGDNKKLSSPAGGGGGGAMDMLGGLMGAAGGGGGGLGGAMNMLGGLMGAGGK